MGLFKLIKIEGQTAGPHLLVTAGIHGDEYEGVEAVKKLVSVIDPAGLAGTLSLVPVANESASARRNRTGGDDLDLARVFPGRQDGTTTERVADELTPLIREVDLYVDLHSGGFAMRIQPYVGYMLVDDDTVLATQRRMAMAFDLPVIWGTSSLLDGRSMSAARDAGVAAIYAEYEGGGACSPEGVESYVAGCLNILAEFGMIEKRAAEGSSAPLVVEDPRPSSGHLQIHHRSPANGTFQSAVTLGEMVSEGDLLGTVDQISIVAESTGLLLCLRANPVVNQGDSLGVVLEII